MASRTVKVLYRLGGGCLVRTRTWGLAPDDPLTRKRILDILARQHGVRPHDIDVIDVVTFHRIENLPPL